jgi:hypothetical protein
VLRYDESALPAGIIGFVTDLINLAWKTLSVQGSHSWRGDSADVRLTIEAASTDGEVLVVPLSAVYSTGSVNVTAPGGSHVSVPDSTVSGHASP